MKKGTKIALGIFLLLILGFIGLRMTGNAVAVGQYDEFAECLSDSGVKMYGAFWCPHCENQKKLFGPSWKKMDYIECSLPNRAQTLACTTAGIQSYPTWEFGDGTRVSGEISFRELSSRTGCQLPA